MSGDQQVRRITIVKGVSTKIIEVRKQWNKLELKEEGKSRELNVYQVR